ncbi:hypothetical protein GCM10009785_26740 [Brooklawnia cerclae]|uniref:HK97 gp10 family phage protein n=1 Tax=Brooklawnia cerclae TaxID=349934 RepID=A0ABX0SG18_9ACTN|nr:HK97-gp10 family putative phage morphogenesis protein [Brooklawnia cerclae]NIH57317.1 HK97 gp10 family phage protein [Brooklawnia cerclae]
MTTVNWDASELNALAADLGKAGYEATRKAQLAVAKAAFDVEAQAKEIAPVKTGALKASIGVGISSDGLTAEVGPTVEYGPEVEYGTSRMAPRAYLGPALDVVGPSFAAAIEQIGGEILS